MGDRVCNEDASIFGILCQIIYNDQGPLNNFIISNDNFKKIYFELL